jgi:16S rRNA processing protein RimM
MHKRIALGRFGRPHGIKGWIKVISYTNPIERILEYKPWHIVKHEEKYLLEKIIGNVQGNHLVVQIDPSLDRDSVRSYTNLEIYVERTQLPLLPEEEYYWVDLIGLTVINCEKENLGDVERLFNTGSNDILVVKEKNGKERYIPYIEGTILNVDLLKKEMIVDWDSTF